MVLTDTHRSIFATWWAAAGRYLLDPNDLATGHALAEAAFEEGVRTTEHEGEQRHESRYETRYGRGGARQVERRQREGRK